MFERGIFPAMTRGRPADFGGEARRISVVELEVPERYFNYIASTKMDEIREIANKLGRIDLYKRTSLPRKLALVIYSEFHQDCEQSERGNPIAQKLLGQRLRIPGQLISLEVNRDASEVLLEAL